MYADFLGPDNRLLLLSRSFSWRIAAYCVLSLALSFAACDEDDEVEQTGDLAVVVHDFNGEVLGGVTVSTIPETSSQTTDRFGGVTYRGIAATTYEVFASLGNAEAKETVRVGVDALADVQLVEEARTAASTGRP